MNIIDEMIMIVEMRITDLQSQLKRLKQVREELDRMPDLLMIAGETAGKFERLMNQVEVSEPEIPEAPVDFGRYEYDRDGNRKRLPEPGKNYIVGVDPGAGETFSESTANGVNHFYEQFIAAARDDIERPMIQPATKCSKCGRNLFFLPICPVCDYPRGRGGWLNGGLA